MKNDSTAAPEFVVCVRNDGYLASLEPRKLYRTIPDADAIETGMIRVVDESGEDYLFPADFFLPVELSHAVEQALLRAS